jgi:hypothetical protein
MRVKEFGNFISVNYLKNIFFPSNMFYVDQLKSIGDMANYC